MYRTYKTFVFFQPDLEKNLILEILKRYYKLLASKKIEFSFRDLGTKVLSYPIKDFSTATQIQITYKGNGPLVEEITKQLSINENIIRFITVKNEE